MKKCFSMFAVLALSLSVMTAGCTQKAASSSDAIQQSKDLATVEQQVDYLVSQANAFVSSKEFDEAINTAKYVLNNLDKNSAEAKNILERAKEEMQKAGEKAMGDMKEKMGSWGQ